MKLQFNTKTRTRFIGELLFGISSVIYKESLTVEERER